MLRSVCVLAWKTLCINAVKVNSWTRCLSLGASYDDIVLLNFQKEESYPDDLDNLDLKFYRRLTLLQLEFNNFLNMFDSKIKNHEELSNADWLNLLRICDRDERFQYYEQHVKTSTSKTISVDGRSMKWCAFYESDIRAFSCAPNASLVYEERLWRSRRLGAQVLIFDANCCFRQSVFRWDLVALVDTLVDQRDGEGFQLTVANAPPFDSLRGQEIDYLNKCLFRSNNSIRDWRGALIDVTEASPISLHRPENVIYLNQNATVPLEEDWDPNAVFVLAPNLLRAVRAAKEYGVRLRRFPLYHESRHDDDVPLNLRCDFRLPVYLHFLLAAQFEGSWTQTAINRAMERCKMFHLEAGDVRSSRVLKNYMERKWKQSDHSKHKFPMWDDSIFVPTPFNQYHRVGKYKGKFVWNDEAVHVELLKYKRHTRYRPR